MRTHNCEFPVTHAISAAVNVFVTGYVKPCALIAEHSYA